MTFGAGGGPDRYKNMLGAGNISDDAEPLSLDINNNNGLDEMADFEAQEKRVSQLEHVDNDIAEKYIKVEGSNGIQI